ncbi:MAG: hypothetical protein RSP_20300 [Rhodanobacter sp.]
MSRESFVIGSVYRAAPDLAAKGNQALVESAAVDGRCVIFAAGDDRNQPARRSLTLSPAANSAAT